MFYDAAIKEDGLYPLQLNHRDAHDALDMKAGDWEIQIMWLHFLRSSKKESMSDPSPHVYMSAE